MTRGGSTTSSSLALSNLRAIVILIVLAFHSMLAYLVFIPAGAAAFDSPPYVWRAFAIVDTRRFFGFDLICAWQDVYLMALMFFLSGLFVAPSLKRKGAWRYAGDRLSGSVCRLCSAFSFSFRPPPIRLIRSPVPIPALRLIGRR
jgi:hypothetical protein